METITIKIINFDKIKNVNYFENIDNEYFKYEKKLLKKYTIKENILESENVEIIKKNIDLNEGKMLDINFFKELIKRREIYDKWKRLSNGLIKKENKMKEEKNNKKEKIEEKNKKENELNFNIDDQNIPIDKNINEKTYPESFPIKDNIIEIDKIDNNENNLIPDKKIKLKGIKKKNDYIKIDEEILDNNNINNDNNININIKNKNEKGFKIVNIKYDKNNENNKNLKVNIKCISCIILIILIVIVLVFIIYDL